jgi:hypothetical protein
MFVLRIIRWVAWALMAVAIFVGTGIAVGWFRTEWLGQSPPMTTTGVPAVGGPLSLVNHRGERVTQETFKGKPTAYFFGFTHCLEVCPTTLFGMTQHLKELGPDADRLNVVFVTGHARAAEDLHGKLRSADRRAHRHARGAGGGSQGILHLTPQGAGPGRQPHDGPHGIP